MFAPEGTEFLLEQFSAAPAVRAGDFVFISGVVGGLRPETERTPEAFEAAIRDAFRRTEHVLAGAGAGWEEVFEMTTFHVNMREHQDIIVDVRRELIAEPPFPTWTAIGVEQLWADELFLEIRVVAYLGEESGASEATEAAD